MARFSRIAVYNAILDTGLLPLFTHHDAGVAARIVQACADGGARAVEFTNRGERAWAVFGGLATECERTCPGVALGVGSVLDAPTAALYLATGASFVVGPTFDADIARLCNRRKVAYIPGCATPSEVSKAEEAGAEIVKLFPGGTVGGPAFVRALRGPMPWSSLMPTGGVELDQANIAEWVHAGAACIGMGSNLVRPEWVASGDYASVTRAVADAIGWIAAARAKT